MADKLRKASSTGVANVATVIAPRAVGETTLSLGIGGLTNWATTTSVDFTTYTLTGGVITHKSDWTGMANPDSNIITDLELTNGTDVGNLVDDIVVCIETSAWINDLIETLLTIFDNTGTLLAGSIPGSAIVNSAISTIKLTDSAVTSNKMSISETSYANVGSAGGTGYVVNLGGIKICYGQTNSHTCDGSAYVINFNGAFVNVHSIVLTASNMVNSIDCGMTNASGLVSSGISTYFISASPTSTACCNWIAIGS